MKKKLIALFLCAYITAFAAGCSSGSETESVSSDAEEVVEDTQETAEEETEEGIISDETGDIVLSAGIIYEDDYISVNAESIVHDETFETYDINISVTNLSDETITADASYVALNGMMMETCWIPNDYDNDIEAGATKEGYIEVSEESLEMSNIEQIGEIEMLWTAFSEDGLSSPVELAYAVIYTELYGTFTQETDFTGEEVFSEGGITVTYIEKVTEEPEYDTNGDTTVYFFVENESGFDIDFYPSDTFMADDLEFDSYLYNDSLIAGTCAIMSLPLGDMFDPDNDYASAETLYFTFDITQMNYGDTIIKGGEIKVAL